MHRSSMTAVLGIPVLALAGTLMLTPAAHAAGGAGTPSYCSTVTNADDQQVVALATSIGINLSSADAVGLSCTSVSSGTGGVSPDLANFCSTQTVFYGILDIGYEPSGTNGATAC